MTNDRLKYATSFKDYPSQTHKEFEKETRINEAFRRLTLSPTFGDGEEYVSSILKSSFGLQTSDPVEQMLDIRAKANRLYERSKIDNPEAMRGVSYNQFLDKYVEEGKASLLKAREEAAADSKREYEVSPHKAKGEAVSEENKPTSKGE